MRRKIDDLEKLSQLNDRRQSKSHGDTSGLEATIKDLKSRWGKYETEFEGK